MLLPVSSPQALGHHLSCAGGGVRDLVELPREEYLGSNLFHMRLIWVNAQPCDPWWSCLAVWVIVLVYSLESEVQTWSLPGPDHLCRSSSGGAYIKDVAQLLWWLLCDGCRVGCCLCATFLVLGWVPTLPNLHLRVECHLSDILHFSSFRLPLKHTTPTPTQFPLLFLNYICLLIWGVGRGLPQHSCRSWRTACGSLFYFVGLRDQTEVC